VPEVGIHRRRAERQESTDRQLPKHGRPDRRPEGALPNKDFLFLGDIKEAGLYGQHLWRNGGRKVVITEGEIDALSVSQAQDNKWPVVSVPNGARGAKKAIQRELRWLEEFEEVVLMFDEDEEGRAAAQECAGLFRPGKCKLARLPMKDANELLKPARRTRSSTRYGALSRGVLTALRRSLTSAIRSSSRS
jgi:5S rRNA maturation endonuclease (ribonuclease M5)